MAQFCVASQQTGEQFIWLVLNIETQVWRCRTCVFYFFVQVGNAPEFFYLEDKLWVLLNYF